LLAGLVAAIWAWTRPPMQPGVDAGREVADEFLTQIREGHPEDAWESTTADFKSDQGKERFVRQVRPLPILNAPLEFVSVETVMIGDHPRPEYDYQSAAGDSVRLVLGRDDGLWKVDRWLTE
jgi:hypothetical protein